MAKNENNLRRWCLEFTKIIICQKKIIKLIAKICYSEICFDEPAVLEQVKTMYGTLFPVQAVLCVQFYTGGFECYLRCDYHLDCKLSYFGGRGKCAEIRIIDISAMGWAIAFILRVYN